MDLISIKRKYRNIRNTIVAMFLIVLIAILTIMINEIKRQVQNEAIYNTYLQQYEQALLDAKIKEEQQKAEEERIRREKLPNLTEQGITNMANLYTSNKKRVFLTFDDGPSKTTTIPILDTLKQENIQATFFVLGSRVELYPSIVKRAYEEGHYIASHGYSHIYSQIYNSAQSVLEEHNKTVNAIRNAVGAQEYNPHLFRFPGGFKGGKYETIKQEAAQLLAQNETVYVDWNALTADSAGAKTTEQFIAELEKTVPKFNSVVVLMHDAGTKKSTADALPQIIAYFRDKGFEFENFYSVIR